MVGTPERAVQLLVTVAGLGGTPADVDPEKESLTVVLEPSTKRCVAAVAFHADTFESPTPDKFATELFEFAVHVDDKLASLGEELAG